MKKPSNVSVLFGICLFLSLIIYLFYREEQTVINQVFQFLFSKETHQSLQNSIQNSIPIPLFSIYSLPEGLWVFAATLASANYFIIVGERQIQLVSTPLLLAVILEIFQVFNITNGTFDWLDLWFAFLFAIPGYLIGRKPSIHQNLFNTFNLSSFMCIGSFLVLYMAHVVR